MLPDSKDIEDVNFKNALDRVQAESYNGGNLVAVIGTSLVQQNVAATASKIAKNSRGWWTWAEFFGAGRFFSPIWHDPAFYSGWEPSNVANAIRYFRGLNDGVSGQMIEQIWLRRDFLAKQVKCDVVIVDAGTNDMSALTAEQIQSRREDIVNTFLAAGKTVILLPILARGTGSWASGSDQRKKANKINRLSRAFAVGKKNLHLFDWNQFWVDSTNADGIPITDYDADHIHFAPFGGVAVGEKLAEFLATLLPVGQPRVVSQDDKYDSLINVYGNLMANPFLSGTGGSVTGAGVSGQVADGMRVELSSGNVASVVCSKEATTNNRGFRQVLTITTAAASPTASLIYLRTSTADTTHELAGKWVVASIEMELGASDNWEGASLVLIDQNGTGGISSYALEPYTAGSADYVPGILKRLPNRVISGLQTTVPILLASNSTTMRWRVEIRVGAQASKTMVAKFGAVELRQVADPRTLVNYTGG